MVKRFNGRISDVLKTNRFDSALDLEQTLMRYVVRRSSFVVRRSSFVVRRSLGSMAFTAHTYTTRNCHNPP